MTPFERREYTWDCLERFGRAFQHDLNNPLGALTGYLDMLRNQMGKLDVAVQPDLSRLGLLVDGLAEASDRLNEILEDAHRTWHPKFASFHRMPVAEFCTAFGAQETKPGFRLEFGKGGVPPVYLMGDAKHLARAVTGMAAETAKHAGVEEGHLMLEQVKAGSLAEAIRNDLPPALGSRDLVRISAVLPGADLKPDTLDRLYYPLNLRNEKRTEGWQFAAGYYVVRKHEGGVAFDHGPEGLGVSTYLPVVE